MNLPERRSPGIKLLFVVLIAAALAVPLMMTYALVWDRQEQSDTARQSITRGWGGPQVVTGPMLVIPYRERTTETTIVDNRPTERIVTVRRNLFLAPHTQSVETELEPERRAKSIYESVIYRARMSGKASFALPDDFERLGIARDDLMLDAAELRFGVSDARGLQSDSLVRVGNERLRTRPGKGLAASNGSGFFAYADWDGQAPMTVDWSYAVRGSEMLSLVPRGGNTQWQVTSAWPHPSFTGSFLPETSDIGDDGFTATYAVPDLALGEGLVMRADPGPPIVSRDRSYMAVEPAMLDGSGERSGPSASAAIQLVEPVDLYSRIDRSVKYGFLIIGFTFLAYFLFDVVGGARVAAAEYLLTGTALILFFVLLLAFAEVIGFTLAYLVAAGAVIGLLTVYGAAVLRSWKRARFMGALLVGLYALLYTLLSLEAWSLLIGSILLFVALAGVMYATRGVDWSGIGRRDGEGEVTAA